MLMNMRKRAQNGSDHGTGFLNKIINSCSRLNSEETQIITPTSSEIIRTLVFQPAKELTHYSKR